MIAEDKEFAVESLISTLKGWEAAVPEGDRLEWWGGILSGVAGVAAASVGANAVVLLGEAIRPLIEECVDDNTH
jgi:hypothetical protein